MMKAIAPLLFAALMLCTAVAAADPLTPFQAGPGDVTLDDVQPHYDASENRDNGNYSEWWSFVFRLENGYWAYVQFLVSNVGLGNGKAAVTAEFRLPDGTTFSERTDLDRGQWSYAKDHFELKFGDNTLGGSLNALKIHLKNGQFEGDYQLTNIAPPWKPGTGRAQYGASASRYYQFQVLAPLAKVEGTLKLVDDGSVHKVKGLIYSDHQFASIGMHEQAKRWARFRSFDPKATLVFANMQTPDVYGNAPIQFAVLFSDGKKVFDSTDLDVKETDAYQDPKKSEYQVPRIVEFATKGEPRVRGAIRAAMDKEKHYSVPGREDFLETAGAAVRFVVSKFAKPIMYDFEGNFAVEIVKDGKKAEYKGKGAYYYTIVNP